MSISGIQSNIERYQREVTEYLKKIADKRKKLAEAKSKAIKAEEDASKSKSSSTIKSRLNEAKRQRTEEAKLTKEIADLERKQGASQKKLDDERNKLSKEQMKEDKKQTAKLAADKKATDKAVSDLNRKVQSVQTEQQRLRSTHFPLLRVDENESFDVFISHASEDKEPFVDHLVQALIDKGVKVWYDKLNIGWGASLRVSIENGLQRSKYAIVVLSPHFLRKYWTNQELNGLFTKETSVGQCILPIWYNITYNDIREYSLILADRLAIDSAINSIDEIVNNFLSILHNG